MKVIHGDLAARNCLLSQDMGIKITDFGLARQLYNYSVYVKTQTVSLTCSRKGDEEPLMFFFFLIL